MTGLPFDLPVRWRERMDAREAEAGLTGRAWLRLLPHRFSESMAEWGLVVDGDPMTGHTALVVPVRRGVLRHALKLVWPHAEGRDESLALRHWAGRGAVRLVAARPDRGALLLERLDPTTTLGPVWTDEAVEIIGGLLRTLHIPAPAGMRTIPDAAGESFERAVGLAGIPRRVLTRCRHLLRDLSTDASAAATLLHTDLHFENVLGDGRGGWRAIDPQPHAGHPGVELQPLLRNRMDELGTGAALRWGVRRLGLLAEASGCDEDLMRLWTIVRTGQQVCWAAADGDREAFTRQVSILKALED